MIFRGFRVFSVLIYVFLLSIIPCTAEAYLEINNWNVSGTVTGNGEFVYSEPPVPPRFPAADTENYTASSDLIPDLVSGLDTVGTGTKGISGLAESRKKLSSDLVQLTDDDFLPPDTSREILVKQMESLKQITRSQESVNPDNSSSYLDELSAGANYGNRPWDETAIKRASIDVGYRNGSMDSEYFKKGLYEGGTSVEKTGSSAEKIGSGLEGPDLVHVYITFYPGNSTLTADSYVEEVTGRDEENQLMAAWVKVDSLESLASLEAVQYVRTVAPPVVRAGTYSTEGSEILNCSKVRAAYGLRGEGIKIGIISNGVDNLTDAVASGDLPDNVSVLSNSEGGNEGTAMLEVVHDIAPGAELYFHDSGNNVIAFNSAVDSLADAGCEIICDDIGWIFEPFFEDGVVASHVSKVVEEKDILYVSAAGNDALIHYQGEFNPGEENFHNFSGGAGEQEWIYGYVPPGGSIIAVFQWNDEWGRSNNDYDLYLSDFISGRIISWSTGVQEGNDLPMESLTYLNTEEEGKNVAILVQKVRGKSGVLELFVYPFSGAFLYANNLVAEDSIYGHPALPGVISVGAISAAAPGNEDIQLSSSRGPVSLYFPRYEVREKPDISGIDGVQVSGAGGFPSLFSGTSAAAPHIAGIAGLVWSGFPEKPATEVRAALLESAVDLEKPGRERSFGHGRADAFSMYGFLLSSVPPPAANFTVNVTAGPAPLNIRLTDLSEKTSSLLWDVNGDNLTDYTGPNPVHTYTEPGTYTVTLIANNSAGSDTLTKPNLINVTEPLGGG